MKLKSEWLNKVIAALVVAAVLSAPVAAAADTKEKKEKAETKAAEPLKDNENPLMIGKRDINKRTPGTLAKIFSTHPATGDRIDKSRAVLTRFPEKDEYTISTSEFNQVKQRLLAINNQNHGVTNNTEKRSAV